MVCGAVTNRMAAMNISLFLVMACLSWMPGGVSAETDGRNGVPSSPITVMTAGVSCQFTLTSRGPKLRPREVATIDVEIVFSSTSKQSVDFFIYEDFGQHIWFYDAGGKVLPTAGKVDDPMAKRVVLSADAPAVLRTSIDLKERLGEGRGRVAYMAIMYDRRLLAKSKSLNAEGHFDLSMVRPMLAWVPWTMRLIPLRVSATPPRRVVHPDIPGRDLGPELRRRELLRDATVHRASAAAALKVYAREVKRLAGVLKDLREGDRAAIVAATMSESQSITNLCMQAMVELRKIRPSDAEKSSEKPERKIRPSGAEKSNGKPE